ncbi:hypothetical protein CLOP_g11045 [Closterium sp. NIES-67]|nr:hypothetical protein CLOP_g11045 [Closterium sp. NIES-67]
MQLQSPEEVQQQEHTPMILCYQQQRAAGDTVTTTYPGICCAWKEPPSRVAAADRLTPSSSARPASHGPWELHPWEFRPWELSQEN